MNRIESLRRIRALFVCDAANLLTALRIPLSVALLFLPPFSVPFILVYALAGLTDVADGAVARRTHTVTDFGAKLDTAADIAFAVAVGVRVLPCLTLPLGLWLWIVAIAAVKIASLVLGAAAIHSWLNKATGLLLFAFVFTVPVVNVRYSAPILCGVATVAAGCELVNIIRRKPWRIHL